MVCFLEVLDDGTLAISMINGTVVFNPYTEEILYRWPILSSKILSLTVFDFDLIATLSNSYDIHILNTKTGEIVRNFSTFIYNYTY